MPFSTAQARNMYMFEEALEGCMDFYGAFGICFDGPNEEWKSDETALVEKNSEVTAYGCQKDASWHLHYLTHTTRQQPFVYPQDEPQAESVVYIVDTAIDTEHLDFEGRAQMVYTQTDTGPIAGHGTHVAGLIGSRTYGVNKRAKLKGVEVLDASGRGSWQTILRGLEWISRQADPTIINMSIGGDRSTIIDRVVGTMSKHGWKFVVAAGNEFSDACTTSPAGSPAAVTVAASDSRDVFASFSNFGKCVDVIAPGVQIRSTWPQQRNAYMSGTSMASPIVAGVWSLRPYWSAEQLKQSVMRGQITKVPASTANVFQAIHPVEQCLVYDERWQFFSQK